MNELVFPNLMRSEIEALHKRIADLESAFSRPDLEPRVKQLENEIKAMKARMGRKLGADG